MSKVVTLVTNCKAQDALLEAGKGALLASNCGKQEGPYQARWRCVWSGEPSMAYGHAATPKSSGIKT